MRNIMLMLVDSAIDLMGARRWRKRVPD